jgi:DNA helicase-4
MKNPAQIPKKVQALDPNCDQVIEVHFMENQEDLAHVLGGVYEDAVGLPPSKKPGKPNEIYSLARNRHFVKKPGVTPNEFEGLHAKWTGDLEAKGAGSYVVKFDTFHGSKGSEAHIAILNGLVTKEVNKRCFPSRMPENELICLPLPRREGFEDAEERRLFYVALTRAKQTVVIPTMLDGMSSFVEELFEHVGTVKFLYKQSRAKICPVCSRGIMVYTDRNHIRCNNTKCELGNTESEHVCPECRKGRILPLLGPYGIWFSCNNYPACKHTDRDRTNKLGKMARLTPA